MTEVSPMINEEVRAQVADWRAAEEHFYGSALADTNLYMVSLRLVRAIVDSLDDIHDLETLVERYGQTDAEYVIPIAERLDIPQLVLLDYELALAAAFYLRSQEIVDAQAETEAKARIAQARAEGKAWVTLYESETKRNGFVFFDRLEMHLPDGRGLHVANEINWEKGRVYIVEPLMLDPETGRIRTDAEPPAPRQEFATREALMDEVEDLREEYSQ